MFELGSESGQCTDYQTRNDESDHVSLLYCNCWFPLIKPGEQNLSILATLLLGLVGSVIGGIIANLIGTGDIFELNVVGFIVAVIAAVLLIGVAESTMGRRPRAG